jgi:uncharacterized protein
MEPIYIPHLKRHPDHRWRIAVDQMVLDLPTLTPVRGDLTIEHQGNYLAVAAQAEAIITLTCHRCLRQYNQRLQLDTSEVIWLDEEAQQEYDGPPERQVDLEDLVESLPPDGHFDPETWLYEHLCLTLPPRQLCGAEDCVVAGSTLAAENPAIDSRWGGLAALRDQLPD